MSANENGFAVLAEHKFPRMRSDEFDFVSLLLRINVNHGANVAGDARFVLMWKVH